MGYQSDEFFLKTWLSILAESNHIRITQRVKFKVLQSLCDTRVHHYGSTCNMSFLVLDLLLEHMSL